MPAVFPSPRALTALALTSLLAGCSVNGAYTDSTAPDAAKLRFVSNTSNSTLDIYDAQHCLGRNTGMLNNFLLVDTKRRVDMIVPPPAKARGLLEVKLEPGKDVMLMINTNGGSYVCGKAVSFTPKAGQEYEVTFDMRGGSCTTLLQRLTRFDGKDQRIPLPIFDKGMTACTGQSPVFGKAFAETPKRVALINTITSTNLQLITLMEPDTQGRLQSSLDEIDGVIAKRKAQLGAFTPPEAYWTQYRQNYVLFNQEMAGRKARTLELYEKVYRLRLSGTEDAVLEQWMSPTDRAITERVKANDKFMERYYQDTDKAMMVETLNLHMERMAELDQRFDVCAHYDQCWHY